MFNLHIMYLCANVYYIIQKSSISSKTFYLNFMYLVSVKLCKRYTEKGEISLVDVVIILGAWEVV